MYESILILLLLMMSSHGTQEISDPVEEMLKKTGCIELHYKVQVRFFIFIVKHTISIFFRNV